MGWKNPDSPVKNIIPGTTTNKETHAYSFFWDTKRPMSNDFLEKDASVTSAFYLQSP